MNARTNVTNLAVGLERLDVRHHADCVVVYYAEETSSHWLVTENDVAELGSMLREADPSLNGQEYSHWCAGVRPLPLDSDDLEDMGIDV